MPIILAAVLSRNGRMLVAASLLDVPGGGFGRRLRGLFPRLLLRRKGAQPAGNPALLTRAREAQIKGYFHRHGFKILVLGRFAVGFRTAAYLTAGILQLPPLKLFLTDLVAASLSTLLMFGLGYAFANQIQSGIQEVQQVLTVTLAAEHRALAGVPLLQGTPAGGTSRRPSRPVRRRASCSPPTISSLIPTRTRGRV